MKTIAYCALILVTIGACSSQPRSEWQRADGVADEEWRARDLANCAARYGPEPGQPLDRNFEIRSCMRSRGWIQAPVTDERQGN